MKNLINRRFVLKGLAGGLAVATTITTGIAIKAATPAFDAAAYIDDMNTSSDWTLHPTILIKDGREVGVTGWLPESIAGGWGPDHAHYEAFKAELRKRDLFKVWTTLNMTDTDTGHRTRFSTYQSIKFTRGFLKGQSK